MPAIPSTIKNGKPAGKPPAKPAAVKPAKKEALKIEVSKREIIHPVLTVCGIEIPPEALIITCAEAKEIMGWETESEYAKRMMEDEPALKAEECKFVEEDLAKIGACILLTDLAGEKVVCWNNNVNRPFDRAHADELGQEVLNRNWVGPSIMEDETVNGEAIIIGRTGNVESGQHRLAGYILCCQRWASPSEGAHWKELWPEEPILESIVVRGVSESPRVLQTIDNVKPRSLADTYYTSTTFADLSNIEKRECSRMMERAVDLLWKRVGGGATTWTKYQTHATSHAFADRHPRLQECVRALHLLDKENLISNLKLSAGQCSAALYLMGSSESNIDDYKNAEPEPCEDALSWEAWERAIEFFSLLAKGDEKLRGVREGVMFLVDADDLLGGREVEKLIVLAKGWAMFAEDGHTGKVPVLLERKEVYYDAEDKVLESAQDAVRTEKHLDEWTSFGGIDLGPTPKKREPAVTADAVEAAKVAKRQQLADEIEAKAKARREAKAGGKPASLAEEAKALLAKRAAKAKVPAQTVAEPGSGKDGQPGLPPAPKIRPEAAAKTLKAALKQGRQSTADVVAAQTAKAKADDARDAKERAAKVKPAAVPAKGKKK